MPHLRRRSLPPQRRPALPLAHEIHQAALAAAMHLQQFFVRNLFHLPPDGGVGEAIAPVRLQILIVERRQIAVEPACEVHAIGYRTNGYFPDRQLRHKACHISWETSRCNLLTVLRCAEVFSARIAMENRSSRLAGLRRPSAINWSKSMPMSVQ